MKSIGAKTSAILISYTYQQSRFSLSQSQHYIFVITQ